MPNESDATTAAMWNAAGQVASTSINAMNTSRYNKKVQKYNEEWNYRQRDWALEDWHRQNEYNLPINVRKRMIEAGLNPALMYGKGPGEMTSGPVRTSPTGSPNFQKQNIDLNAGSTIMTYLGVQKQTAELEQMQLQNDLLREKTETQRGLTQLTWNKAALTENENHKIEMWISAAKNYEETAPKEYFSTGSYYGDQMRNEVQKRGQEISNMFDENQRREIFTANNTTMVIAKVGQIAIQNAKTEQEREAIKQNIELLKKSNILQGYQIDGERFLKNVGPAAQILRAVISGK